MADKHESNSFKSFEEFLEAFCDFLSYVEQFGNVASRLKQQIAKFAGVEEQPKYDIDEIRWEAAQGSSGTYERSEDISNPHFKALLKDVQARGGKMTVGDYFVWVVQFLISMSGLVVYTLNTEALKAEAERYYEQGFNVVASGGYSGAETVPR